MSTDGQFIYVDPGPPPPVCVTVKTNQIGLEGSHFEPGQTGQWTAPGGGVGTHYAYEYLDHQSLPNVLEQFIVMSDWNETAFLAGEVLTLT